MRNRKHKITLAQILAAAGAFIACSGSPLPEPLPIASWCIGLGLLAWAVVR